MLDGRLPERFWNLVVPEPMSGCWLWIGAGNRNDYGVFRMNGGARLSHRVSVAAARGPLDGRLVLDHRCRTTFCVNPAHIEQVTQRVNSRRNYRSTRTHCAKGHEFTEGNTYRHAGTRKCRRCHADRQADRIMKRKPTRGGSRPGAGRPPDGDVTRDRVVRLRVTTATLERWKATAARENQTLSKWIEEAADTAFARGNAR